MGLYNPYTPYVLGMEFPPLIADTVYLDTASEIGYTFRQLVTDSAVDRSRFYVTEPPPGQFQRKEILVNIYRSDQVAATGPIRKTKIAVTSGTRSAGATLQGGAISEQEAVQNPSDQQYIQMLGPGVYCRFWFDVLATRVQQLLQYKRVLDVTILYSMSGPFADLANAVTLSIERVDAPAAIWPMDTAITGPALQTSNTVPRRSRLGELNPFWWDAGDPTVTFDRRPWRWADGINNTAGLVRFAAAVLAPPDPPDLCIRFSTSASATAAQAFDIHYVAMEVTYCEESRVGAGGLDVSDGAGFVNAAVFGYEPTIGSITSLGADCTLVAGTEYAITIGQAHVGALSVTGAVPVSVNTLDTVTRFYPHRGVLLRKSLRENETHTVEETTRVTPGILYDGPTAPGTIIEETHGYVTQAIGTPSDRWALSANYQVLIDDVAATYVWVRFYARHVDGCLDALTVYHVDAANVPLGPQASISVDEFDALPEIVDGWAAVTLRWSAPVVTAGAGVQRFAFASSADSATPWQILGADANPGTLASGSVDYCGYGADTGFAHFDGQTDLSADLSVMLIQEMDPVTGFTLTPAVQPLSAVDECCGLPVDAMPTGIYYHALTWDAINTGVVAGWGHYEIQRRDTTMATGVWETIATITTPVVTSMDDYEARVGVLTSYRIRMVHTYGVEGAWSAEVTGTIPAPGVTGTTVDRSVLILTSNEDPDANLAHAMVWTGRPEESFDFPEGGLKALQDVYGRDYRTAFWPTERAGTQFTRTLLINAVCIPTSTMDKGFTGLRDLAWQALPYVCVRDELSNRWLSTLFVPSGVVRRIPDRGHLELAALTVAEVTATPAPYDTAAPCEGLTVEGSMEFTTAETTLPVLMSPGATVVADTFTRVVADSWGTADTGGAYTHEPVSVDYDVNGTKGTMALTAINGTRRAYLGAVTNPDAAIDITMPVAVTGATISTSIMLRISGILTDYYEARLIWGTAGTLSLSLIKRVASVTTTITTVGLVPTYVAGDTFTLRARVRCGRFEARAWKTSTTEPYTWDAATDLTDLYGTWPVGIRANADTGVTNPLPVTIAFDNLRVYEVPETLDVRAEIRPTGNDFAFYVYGQNIVILSPTSYTTTGSWDLYSNELVTGMDVSDTGFFTQEEASADFGVVPNRRRWVRFLYDGWVGAGNARVDFYSSDDGVVWTPVSNATAASQPVENTPSGVLGVSVYHNTTVMYVEVYVNGVLVADPDFAAQAPGTTTFADTRGNTWIVDGDGICAGTT